MRHLLLTENITADGRTEMLDEWFSPSPDGDMQDWLIPFSARGDLASGALVTAGHERSSPVAWWK